MRIDGWKSIAAYFGRERSTVMRWATDRNLPVHRIPGKGRGSVYALSEELDAWLEADREAPQAADQEAPLQDTKSGVARWIATLWQAATPHRFLLMTAALLLAVLALTTYPLWGESSSPETADLPEDAALADLYLEARSDWAARNPESISASIGKLRKVVAGEPGFAQGYAALADAYVLAREFGSLPDVEAFALAQSAADTALRINPENPDAMRASAFVEYWWRGRRSEAGRLFRAAIAADPKSAQSHFWYGNVLVDNGDFAEGLAELERARLLEPASVPLQADIAWARWSMGEHDRATAALERLRDDNPQLATVRDYLAVIYLARGDVARFVDESVALARNRALEADIAQGARMRAALGQGARTVPTLLLRELEAEIEANGNGALPWAVFVATAAQDRAAVIRLLEIGRARGEKWGSAGLMRHVREAWKGDGEVAALLASVRPASMVEAP